MKRLNEVMNNFMKLSTHGGDSSQLSPSSPESTEKTVSQDQQAGHKQKATDHEVVEPIQGGRKKMLNRHLQALLIK